MDKPLELILESHDTFLLDASLCNKDNNFTLQIYDASKFSQVKNKELQQVIDGMLPFQELCKEENIYTIKEIVQEIDKFHKILQQKREFLFDVSIILPKNVVNKFHKAHNIKARKLFKEINEVSYANKRAAQKCCLPEPQDALFEALFKGITLVSHRINLKKDHEKTYIGNMRQGKKKKNTNDEKLLAYAMYRAIKYDESVGILTGDFDFARMYNVGIPTLFCDEFLQYHHNIRKKLEKSNIKIYTRKIDVWSGIIPHKSYKTHCYSINNNKRQNEALYFAIKEFWEKHTDKNL